MKKRILGIPLILAMAALIVVVSVSVIYTEGEGVPGIDDAPSAMELGDLQFIASQKGISLQEAIDRHGWNDNFALAVSKIREAAPAAFTGAEIVDGDNAWVGFASSAPQAALDIINSFRDSHSGVSVAVRADQGFTENELKSAIKAVHYAMFETAEVADAITSFDSATGKITTVVVLATGASESVIDNLRAVAATKLTDATRDDIVNSITTSVNRSDQEVLGGEDVGTKHWGGEALRTCTSGFGTKDSSGVRGISTAGHCSNSQTDDGVSLTFKDEHLGTHGDFQWHTGSQSHSNSFYSGDEHSSEVGSRSARAIGAPTVGQSLCRNGKVSNRDCQEVRKLDVCNGNRCSLVQMGERQSAGGDSGGPVYYMFTAYGLHQGWMYDPWPLKRDVFSRADLMDDALGTNVATD